MPTFCASSSSTGIAWEKTERDETLAFRDEPEGFSSLSWSNRYVIAFSSRFESAGCDPAGGEVGIPACYAGLRKQTQSPMRKPIIPATLVHFALRCALCSTLFTTQAHDGYRYQFTVVHTQAGSSDSASFPILVYI